MDSCPTFTAATEDELWQQVIADMTRQQELWSYAAVLRQGHYSIRFAVDIDLGGGFEGGTELTSFRAAVPHHPTLRFALHEQDWVNEIGKLLGLTDVELGDAELDAAFIITTNDAEALRTLLQQDADLRQTLLRYPTCRLTLAPATHAANSPVELTFTLDRAVVEAAELRAVYQLVYRLLQLLDGAPAPDAG